MLESNFSSVCGSFTCSQTRHVGSVVDDARHSIVRTTPWPRTWPT